MMETQEKFYYKATRDIVCVVIGTVLTIVVFFIMKALLDLLEGGDERIRYTKTLCICTYLVIAIPCIIGCIVSAYIKTYSCLIIKKQGIIYRYGWLTKHVTTIPAYKIRSCSKSSGVIQRLCNTMNISITTAGDREEIYFSNIKNGETAYRLIVQLARANEH